MTCERHIGRNVRSFCAAILVIWKISRDVPRKPLTNIIPICCTFFRYMKRQRGLVSPDTEDEAVSLDGVDLEFVRSVTLNDVYEYLNYTKNERGNSNKTRARKVSSLRMFFRYLTDKTHQLEHNPVQNLDTPKSKKSLPKYLSLEQSLELLTKVKGEFPERDYCMLVLLLNCGLRRAELAGLNLEDIGRDNTLRVHGKGNKERMLYLNEACRNALAQYLKVRPVDGVARQGRAFSQPFEKAHQPAGRALYNQRVFAAGGRRTRSLHP